MATRGGTGQQSRNGVATERGFEDVIVALLDRIDQPIPASGPRQTVGRCLVQTGVALAQPASDLIGIEILAAPMAKVLAEDAALAGAVGAGDGRDRRDCDSLWLSHSAW